MNHVDKKENLVIWIVMMLACLVSTLIFLTTEFRFTLMIGYYFLGTIFFFFFGITLLLKVKSEELKIPKWAAVAIGIALIILGALFAVNPIRDLIDGPVEEVVTIKWCDKNNPDPELRGLWQYEAGVKRENGEEFTLRISGTDYHNLYSGDKIRAEYYPRTRVLKNVEILGRGWEWKNKNMDPMSDSNPG